MLESVTPVANPAEGGCRNAMNENPAALATELLLDWDGADGPERDALVPVVYDELRRIAQLYLSRERPEHTLQPTALVHEAYLRLIDQRRVDWRNRAQFIGLSALMMRRVLVNHARARAADKRGGGAERVSLTFAEELFEPPQVDVLAIPDALDRLQVGSKRGAHGRNRSSRSASRICRATGRSGRPT